MNLLLKFGEFSNNRHLIYLQREEPDLTACEGHMLVMIERIESVWHFRRDFELPDSWFSAIPDWRDQILAQAETQDKNDAFHVTKLFLKILLDMNRMFAPFSLSDEDSRDFIRIHLLQGIEYFLKAERKSLQS